MERGEGGEDHKHRRFSSATQIRRRQANRSAECVTGLFGEPQLNQRFSSAALFLVILSALGRVLAQERPVAQTMVDRK